MTKEEIDEFGIQLSEFPPMTLNHLRHRIKHIDDKYPWSMNPNILLAMLLIALLLGLIVVGYFLYTVVDPGGVPPVHAPLRVQILSF